MEIDDREESKKRDDSRRKIGIYSLPCKHVVISEYIPIFVKPI